MMRFTNAGAFAAAIFLAICFSCKTLPDMSTHHEELPLPDFSADLDDAEDADADLALEAEIFAEHENDEETDDDEDYQDDGDASYEEDPQIVLTAEEQLAYIDLLGAIALPEPVFADPVVAAVVEDEAEDAAPDTVAAEPPPPADSGENAASATESPPAVAAAPEPPPVSKPTPPAPPRLPATVRPAETKPLEPPPVAAATPPVQVIQPVLPARNPALEPITPPKTEISRTVNAMVNQTVEIPYRGTNWVFLGEQSGNRGIAFDSRRIEDEGMSFVFRAEKPGSYLLKFYKQDYLQDYYINDFVQVNILPAPNAENRLPFGPPQELGRVVALPRWPGPRQSAPADNTALETQANAPGNVANTAAVSGNAASGATTAPATAGTQAAPGAAPSTAATGANPPSANAMATPGNTASGAAAAPTTAGNQAAAPASAASGMKATSDNSAGVATGEIDPADLLKQARAAYDAGKFDQAIAALDQFRRIYPAAGDEAWWLYGQSFEANSPSRDIRSAMDAYTRLAREFPQSKYYDDAQKRIAYLNKFYFNIR